MLYKNISGRDYLMYDARGVKHSIPRGGLVDSEILPDVKTLYDFEPAIQAPPVQPQQTVQEHYIDSSELQLLKNDNILLVNRINDLESKLMQLKTDMESAISGLKDQMQPMEGVSEPVKTSRKK